jgi:hypothetical protein
MSRLALVLSLLGACATARRDEAPTDAAGSDTTHRDAAVTTHDAPAGGCTFTGTLVTWDLTGQPGTQATTAATAMASGVTGGALTRTATLTAVSAANAINASGWPTAAQVDTSKYFAFSLAPPSGCTVSITSLAIDVKASATGPATAVIATDADNFATKTTISTSAPSTPALTVDATASRELRVYGYSATGASGTMRIQNTLTVTGSVH